MYRQGITVHADPPDAHSEALERSLEIAFDARPPHLRYTVTETSEGDVTVRFEPCA